MRHGAVIVGISRRRASGRDIFQVRKAIAGNIMNRKSILVIKLATCLLVGMQSTLIQAQQAEQNEQAGPSHSLPFKTQLGLEPFESRSL